MTAKYNITINKYSDFARTFSVASQGVAVDLTDHTFRGSLKQDHTQPTGVDFTTTIIDATEGLFAISLTSEQTGDMKPGNWVYDIVMTNPSGERSRLFEGQAFVRAGVTQ